MSFRSICVLGFACFLCASAVPLNAAPNAGRIAGIVVDSAGTPHMGATVLVYSHQLLLDAPIQLLTNDRGRFSTASLPTGTYSIHVTLAGFLPSLDQNVKVDQQQCSPCWRLFWEPSFLRSTGFGASLTRRLRMTTGRGCCAHRRRPAPCFGGRMRIVRMRLSQRPLALKAVKAPMKQPAIRQSADVWS